MMVPKKESLAGIHFCFFFQGVHAKKFEQIHAVVAC